MKGRFSILLASTFACGFLCAWLAKPAESLPPPEETAAKRDSRSPRRVTPDRRESSAMRNADARIAGLLDDGQDWQPGSDEGYPRLLEALRRRASLTGTKYEFRKLLNDIVVDPEYRERALVDTAQRVMKSEAASATPPLPDHDL